MASGRDEVEESMNPVVAETRVTLDTGLLRKNVIVLALEMANNLLEAEMERRVSLVALERANERTYANSLSMLSPNPGVSTMVRAIRTPSSSNSTS